MAPHGWAAVQPTGYNRILCNASSLAPPENRFRNYTNQSLYATGTYIHKIVKTVKKDLNLYVRYPGTDQILPLKKGKGKKRKLLPIKIDNLIKFLAFFIGKVRPLNSK